MSFKAHPTYEGICEHHQRCQWEEQYPQATSRVEWHVQYACLGNITSTSWIFSGRSKSAKKVPLKTAALFVRSILTSTMVHELVEASGQQFWGLFRCNGNLDEILRDRDRVLGYTVRCEPCDHLVHNFFTRANQFSHLFEAQMFACWRGIYLVSDVGTKIAQ